MGFLDCCEAPHSSFSRYMICVTPLVQEITRVQDIGPAGLLPAKIMCTVHHHSHPQSLSLNSRDPWCSFPGGRGAFVGGWDLL